MKWNKFDKDFLISNYSNNGVEYCSNKLNRTKGTVCSMANKLKLYSTPETKSRNIINSRKKNNYKKFNVTNITNISNKYSSYFLGYLWADGHVRRTNGYLTSINLIEDDALFLYNILTKISDGWVKGKKVKKYWTNSEGIKKQVNNQLVISSHSQELYYFLIENDYNSKSLKNFQKIWDKIPVNFKKYFLLGLIDGDGHFNYQFRQNKYHSGELVITSNYEYDWSTLENFYKINNIEYKIYRLIVPLGKVSKIVVRKRKSLNILFNLLYDGTFYGLNRKYIKFLKYYETN